MSLMIKKKELDYSKWRKSLCESNEVLVIKILLSFWWLLGNLWKTHRRTVGRHSLGGPFWISRITATCFAYERNIRRNHSYKHYKTKIFYWNESFLNGYLKGPAWVAFGQKTVGESPNMTNSVTMHVCARYKYAHEKWYLSELCPQ